MQKHRERHTLLGVFAHAVPSLGGVRLVDLAADVALGRREQLAADWPSTTAAASCAAFFGAGRPASMDFTFPFVSPRTASSAAIGTVQAANSCVVKPSNSRKMRSVPGSV